MDIEEILHVLDRDCGIALANPFKYCGDISIGHALLCHYFFDVTWDWGVDIDFLGRPVTKTFASRSRLSAFL